MASGIFTKKQVNQAILTGAWSSAPTYLEYLVVAGGGGAGGIAGAGGGGVQQGSIPVTLGATISVTVGAGGSGGGGNSGLTNTNGSNSTFGFVSALGGGTSSASGGSGGGGGANEKGGQGAAGQGNSGGFGLAASGAGAGYFGGGGGGAGSPGIGAYAYSGGAVCGNGGSGIGSDISGTRLVYGGGGGGGWAFGGSAGQGGAGGGGAGGDTASSQAGVGGNGLGGFGGGGGAGSYNAPYGVGGSGGAGVVIVRYPGTVQYYTGGDVSSANGYIIHTFFASGSLAPTVPTTYVTPAYQISRSLRFDATRTTYLARDYMSAAGNRQTFTWSAWIKRSLLASTQYLFGQASSDTIAADIRFLSDDTFSIVDESISISVATTPIYRDPSAWYHFMVAVDTTQATAANRVKLYVNGSQVTSLATANYPAQNASSQFNTTNTAIIGTRSGAATPYQYFSGYMADVYLIDGQALTPSSFGQADSVTGIWSPKAYTGTYGTNGFFLNFSDNTTTTSYGKDYSGNNKYFKSLNFAAPSSNISLNDSGVDVPTNWGSDQNVGGTVRGNYCTLNPLTNTGITLKNGNLSASNDTANDRSALGTIAFPSTGKWYYEARVDTISSTYILYIGLKDVTGAYNAMLYPRNANTCFYLNSSASCVAETNSVGDVFGVAYNADTGLVDFYRNGVKYNGQSVTVTSGYTYFPFLTFGNTGMAGSVNFGQRPWAYQPPSGYKALCAQNLPTPTIGATSSTLASKYFNPVLYTGNSGVNAITGMGFQPDLLWNKTRSNAANNVVNDAVRGINKVLIVNDITTTEITGTTYLNSFDSDGFTLNTASPAFNYTGYTYVAWGWKANGSGSTNTSGSITSTVSANTTSGFSIVTFTGTGANATVGHGLGVAPSMIITKPRNNADDWYVYHASLGPTLRLALNLTNASAPSAWNNTAPTSTVFSISSGGFPSGWTEVAYCWAEVAGYSKFGSYTGNGSTNRNFIYTGFVPALVLVKKTSASGTNWRMVTPRKAYVSPNVSDAEYASYPGPFIEMANGFEIYGGNDVNENGSTFIYAAFAESPFKYSIAK